jgi:excinuclease UvrABC nuclease subunit
MKRSAADLEFEKAAMLRDQVFELRELLMLRQTDRKHVPIWEQDRMMPVADIEPGEA